MVFIRSGHGFCEGASTENDALNYLTNNVVNKMSEIRKQCPS